MATMKGVWVSVACFLAHAEALLNVSHLADCCAMDADFTKDIHKLKALTILKINNCRTTTCRRGRADVCVGKHAAPAVSPRGHASARHATIEPSMPLDLMRIPA